MKRFLCALLAVVMLCTMAVSMVSCFASIDSMEKNCKKLKEDGEIAYYTVADEATLKFVSDKAVAAISAGSLDDKGYFSAVEFDKGYFSAVEFDKTADAKEYYEEAQKDLDEMEAAGVDVSEYVLKRDGKIVITCTSKDLYKKIA